MGEQLADLEGDDELRARFEIELLDGARSGPGSDARPLLLADLPGRDLILHRAVLRGIRAWYAGPGADRATTGADGRLGLTLTQYQSLEAGELNIPFFLHERIVEIDRSIASESPRCVARRRLRVSRDRMRQRIHSSRILPSVDLSNSGASVPAGHRGGPPGT